jgi:serine/threonine protein kinase
VEEGTLMQLVTLYSSLSLSVILLFSLLLQVLGGTILYSPPDDDEMSFSFDDWACGVILFAMLTCSLPFAESDLIAKRNLTLHIPEAVPDGTLPFRVTLGLFFFFEIAWRLMKSLQWSWRYSRVCCTPSGRDVSRCRRC